MLDQPLHRDPKRASRTSRRWGLATRYTAGFCVIAGLTASGDAAEPVFVETTVEAGLGRLQYEMTDPPNPHGMVYMTGGAAAGDYDGDGLVDLYVTRLEAADSLYLNNGDGTFDDVSADAGLGEPLLTSNGAAWADIDNDGDLDLYVTTVFDTRFYLFINDGAGRFTEEGVERGAAVAGFDTHYGQSVTFGDYDLDGWLDIHTTEWRRNDINPTGAPSNARLLRNLGAAAPGHFEDVTVDAGVALDGTHPAGTYAFTSRFADLDEDGWPDLLIASDYTTSRLFWNNGDGTFTDGTVGAGVGTDENGMGSAVGDYDGDGRLDWFVTSIHAQPGGANGNRLYRNLGNRLFADTTDAAGVRDGGWGWGAAFLDYDNDADLDLVMTNGIHALVNEAFSDDPTRLWRNDGTGAMTDVSVTSGITDTGSGKGLLHFDYDNDGDQDLLILNNAEYPILYRNDDGNANNWLRVETRGWGNRQGIGARVTVTPTIGAPVQVREINCGSHYLSQSDTAAHFGLGQGTAPVHEVAVRWPMTHTLQRFNDVPRNTTFVAQEPVPPLRLEINGEHPASRRVMTTGNVLLTLDVTPGPFAEPFGWYFAYRFNEATWIFLTASGSSPTPAPLLTSPPFRLEDLVIGQTTLPLGASMTFAVFFVDGGTIVARDHLSCVVVE